ERTRASVLAAAKDEFSEHGYVLAKIDRIAERAELTRGAVYSNFPSKRALYLAVLIDLAENAGGVEPQGGPASLGEALGSFARVWLERLPLVGDTVPGGRLQLRSLDGVFDDGHAREVLAQTARLEALLLGLALESCAPARQVRLASLVLTLLDGASHQAEVAPGSGDPFDVALACEHLAGVDLADTWAPPHLPFVEPGREVAEFWVPPEGRAELAADCVIAVLGANRLAAAEEAVRSLRPGERATVVVVASNPAETGRLVRLRVSDLMACLRRVFTADVVPSLDVLFDEDAVVAALGIAEAGDYTEAAVRVESGAIVARAEGRGAAHAVAGRRADR
ncbi:MAG TPA: helix-turn-helix domain-containing protein, partial [Lentzea sp.]